MNLIFYNDEIFGEGIYNYIIFVVKVMKRNIGFKISIILPFS